MLFSLGQQFYRSTLYIYIYIYVSTAILTKHGDVCQYSHLHQKLGWFHYQSADHSTGRIYLQMTWTVCYLPMLCFFDPDNRLITSWSCWSVSKQMKPHNLESKNKYKSMPRNREQNKARKITISSMEKTVLQKWYIYSSILDVASFSQRPVHELTVCQFLI